MTGYGAHGAPDGDGSRGAHAGAAGDHSSGRDRSAGGDHSAGTDQSARGAQRSAVVVTASDRAAQGTRADASGELVAARLAEVGFSVQRRVVPDEAWAIEEALVQAAAGHPLVITTGGTGLTPRDVTPQATAAVIDYEIPGIAEAMRAEGRRSTPLASLSRGIAGVRGRTLIVNLPGSPRGAMESLEAVIPLLDHALETIAGPFDHASACGAGREDLPPGLPGDSGSA